MKIDNEKPKCFDRLLTFFGDSFDLEKAWKRGLVITYDAKIHCIFNEIPDDMMVHEMVHVQQQTGVPADEYVERFLTDTKFRMINELAAFQAQAKFLRETIKNQEALQNRLSHMWYNISSPLYGRMISYKEAKKLI